MERKQQVTAQLASGSWRFYCTSIPKKYLERRDKSIHEYLESSDGSLWAGCCLIKVQVVLAENILVYLIGHIHEGILIIRKGLKYIQWKVKLNVISNETLHFDYLWVTWSWFWSHNNIWKYIFTQNIFYFLSSFIKVFAF